MPESECIKIRARNCAYRRFSGNLGDWKRLLLTFACEGIIKLLSKLLMACSQFNTRMMISRPAAVVGEHAVGFWNREQIREKQTEKRKR